MSFASPFSLLFLLAIGIPIYLHLYFKKKPVLKNFPSLILIKAAYEKLAQRNKVANWVLMALRVLTIILICLLFAHPFWGGTAGNSYITEGASAFVILLDNSMSMGYTHQGISIFDTAKSKAMDVLDQMRENDRASFGYINSPGGLSFNQLTSDKESLKKSISDSVLSARGTSITNAFSAAVKLLTPLKAYKRSIYVISDMTMNAWRSFMDSYDLSEPDKEIDFILIPVGKEDFGNMSVTSLETESNAVITGRNIRVKATINNYTLQTRNTKAVLSINGESKAVTHVKIQPNSGKDVNFDVVFQKEGMNKLTVEIDGDGLESDNIRTASIRAYKPCKVLIVKPNNNIKGQENREEIFVDFALNPLKRRANNIFTTDTLCTDEVSGVDLNLYDAVILINQRHPSKDFLTNLSTYLISGGTLLTFLGDKTEPEYYNKKFNEELGDKYLLPGKLFKRIGNAVSKENKYSMTDIDKEHPAFSIFQKDGSGEPETASVYEFFRVQPNERSINLCRMNHGFPGIIEEKRGMGRSMLITFTADTSWSNWPTKPTWLPFIHNALLSMITANNAAIGKIKPGMPVNIALPDKDFHDLKVKYPNKTEEKLHVIQNNKKLSQAIIKDTEETGYYEIKKGSEIITAFAVNPPADESNLSKIEVSKIPRFLILTDKSDDISLKSKVEAIKHGFDLSGIIIILLIISVCTEHWLANKVKGRREQ